MGQGVAGIKRKTRTESFGGRNKQYLGTLVHISHGNG
jgi:hypothetical protein